ncbi:MAG: efflux RND transporter periplasmic adaptor subunit [Nibricoccus sp.]
MITAKRHFFILGASALSFASGCKPQPKTAATPPPAEVQVTRPVQRDEPLYAEWVGTLDGLVNAQVRAQVAGYLLRQNYSEGSAVKKGDLLFEVDPRPFQAIVDQAKANAERAEADFKRVSALADQQVVARQEYDTAVAAHASTKAALQQAELNLEFTKIRSPIDGIAGLATAQIGDLVSAGSGVLTTVSTVDPIKVYFPISEQAYLKFRNQPAETGRRFPEDMELELVLSDGSTYSQKGKFFAIDRNIDPNTGTMRVAATFPNADNLLRPGQYARVRALVGHAKNSLQVPQRAVIEVQGVYQVAVVGSDHISHLRTVKLGPKIGSQWIVTDGLKPDDQVVVEGVQKVKEGAVVAEKPFMTAMGKSQQAAAP